MTMLTDPAPAAAEAPVDAAPAADASPAPGAPAEVTATDGGAQGDQAPVAEDKPQEQAKPEALRNPTTGSWKRESALMTAA